MALAIKDTLRSLLRRCGYDVRRDNPATRPECMLQTLLCRANVDLVLDVGANSGQYGHLMRSIGYRGEIISFEPSSAAHALLLATASADQHWKVTPRLALSDRAGDAVLHVAGNSASSSLLNATSLHDRAAPHAKTMASERVRCERLDTAAKKFITDNASVLLKIDTQGTEDRVLAGAAGILSLVQVIQIELSFAPLYEGQAGHLDLMRLVKDLGFDIFSIHPNFYDPVTAALLQCDAFFIRSGIPSV
ncbi:MAG: FkbM family methyltransferase [Xanthomonadales bacterium]|nr:FkbM family methyltransferase [Xanthomonadales bacterium]